MGKDCENNFFGGFIMKVLYFISLLIVALFFNACAPQKIVYSPDEIDTFAIPPSAENNLFSPPPKGYARLIMYRDDSNIGFLNYVFISYEIYNKADYEYSERALCRLDSNSSCIVNIKADNTVVLYNIYEPTVAMQIFARRSTSFTQGTIFTPKNQHIYCLAIESRTSFAFKDKNVCLNEYKDIYKPKHRKEQERWLNKLIKNGDKRAYKE